jgi:hypothetical protein
MSVFGSSDETGYLFNLALKLTGFFLTFVGGIVTATWAVASKIKGFDDRLKSVESVHMKIDLKLDRIHERIDEILLSKAEKQKESNGSGI